MNPWDLVLAAVADTPKAPNLWGALGCAMAYSAALLAALDAFADMLLARQERKGVVGPALSLKLGGKLTASGLTVASAGAVLALDANWFAFGALSIVFVVVILAAIAVMRRSARAAQSSPEVTATS